MYEQLKILLLEPFDVNDKLNTYTSEYFTQCSFNKSDILILYKLLEHKKIDPTSTLNMILESFSSKLTKVLIIPISMLIRYGAKVEEDSFNNFTSTIKSLLDDLYMYKIGTFVSDNKYHNIFYDILLNKNNIDNNKFNDTDYVNIISTFNNSYNILNKNGYLLKNIYRSYNYDRFVEFINNDVIPDYTMINDIVIYTRMSKGIAKYYMIKMIKYMMYKCKITLDKYQINILLNYDKIQLNYVSSLLYDNYNMYKKKSDKVTTLKVNVIENSSFIIDINESEVHNYIISKNIITKEDSINYIINSVKNIVYNYTSKKLDKIKIPSYTYHEDIKLTLDHSFFTFCVIIYQYNLDGKKEKMLDLIKS